MPEERDGQIDQGSKGEVGDLSDVARGFAQNVTAKGLARLCENCVDDAGNGWLDSAGRWKDALPTKRVLRLISRWYFGGCLRVTTPVNRRTPESRARLCSKEILHGEVRATSAVAHPSELGSLRFPDENWLNGSRETPVRPGGAGSDKRRKYSLSFARNVGPPVTISSLGVSGLSHEPNGADASEEIATNASALLPNVRRCSRPK